MEDRVVAKELDEWIAKLEDCKQLEETQVKVLCEKVRCFRPRTRTIFYSVDGHFVSALSSGRTD